MQQSVFGKPGVKKTGLGDYEAESAKCKNGFLVYAAVYYTSG